MPLNSTTTCGSPDASGTYTCITLYAADPSSTPSVANGFTYGEIINSILLFGILMGVMVVGFHLMFRRTKIKN